MTLADIIALYDGEWFDVVTALGGLFLLVLNRFRAPPGRPFFSTETGFDFFNGLAIAPLCFLFFSLFTTKAMTVLVQHNRIILPGAAVVALFSLLKKP